MLETKKEKKILHLSHTLITGMHSQLNIGFIGDSSHFQEALAYTSRGNSVRPEFRFNLSGK